MITASGFLEEGLELVDKQYERHKGWKIDRRVDQYHDAFGSHPLVHARMYHDLKVYEIDHERKAKYFLMSQSFLRKYWREKDMLNLFGFREQTCREWVWYYIECIQELKTYKVSRDSVVTVFRKNNLLTFFSCYQSDCVT